MNISTSVIFSDLMKRDDIPDNVRPVIDEIVTRLDVALGEILSGIKNEPTVFSLGPTEEENEARVEGAKSGDIAVFRDDGGVVRLSLFD